PVGGGLRGRPRSRHVSGCQGPEAGRGGRLRRELPGLRGSCRASVLPVLDPATRAAVTAEALGAVQKISPEAARRFLVAHHLLGPARALQGGPDAVMEVVRRLGSVQFDPLAVAGRNHDLVLHARVAGYDPAWTDELLYGRRELFEAYNKALCLLPTSELPWYRVSWTQTVNSPRILAENRKVAKQVLERIRAEGPLSSVDFERGPTMDWWLGPSSVVRLVLASYAATGVLGLARRQGNRRYYDLTERLFPADLLAVKIPRREQLRHKMLSRFRAHGLPG